MSFVKAEIMEEIFGFSSLAQGLAHSKHSVFEQSHKGVKISQNEQGWESIC